MTGSNRKDRKIIRAYTKYGDKAASARYRFLQYRPYLEAAGVDLDVRPLLDNSYLEKTFNGRPAPKLALARSYILRCLDLARGTGDGEALWIQYELFPYAPSLFETLLLRSATPVICDYDDAIFHQYDQNHSPLLRKLLAGKLQPLLKRADLTLCGNEVLSQYARQFCPNVELIPTVVDATRYTPSPEPRTARPTVIGWIGAPSTWKYVRPMIPLLKSLAAELGLRIRIVGAGPHEPIEGFEFLEWSEEREVADLQSMDIGIMPLPDDEWARGKCGFKLIQYMGCGLPVVASPVGVNAQIVQHGVQGFLASSHADWEVALRRLVADAALRAEMAAKGRERVERAYSLQVYGPIVAQLIRHCCETVPHRPIGS